MAVIREHLASQGLGLHNDLQNEHSIVGNFPCHRHVRHFGTPAQKENSSVGALNFEVRLGVRPDRAGSGSEATHMETRPRVRRAMASPAGGSTARRCGSPACTQRHIASVFARTEGNAGDARASPASSFRRRHPASRSRSICGPSTCRPITLASVSPMCGFEGARCSASPSNGLSIGAGLRARKPDPAGGEFARCGGLLRRGEREIRPGTRMPFGRPLAENQAIQWPLVELATQTEMLRQLIRRPRGKWTRCHIRRSRCVSPTRCRCATTGPTEWFAMPPTGDAGSWRHRLLAPQTI